MDIYQLVYLSFAKNDFSHEMIQELLEKSRSNNEQRNISGMLLYKGGIFLQLLEGKESAVKDTYKKIAKDERHHNLKVLIEAKGNKRLFGDWTMAFKEVNSPDLNLIDTILPWSEIINKENKSFDNDKILMILKEFRYQLN